MELFKLHLSKGTSTHARPHLFSRIMPLNMPHNNPLCRDMYRRKIGVKENAGRPVDFIKGIPATGCA